MKIRLFPRPPRLLAVVLFSITLSSLTLKAQSQTESTASINNPIKAAETTSARKKKLLSPPSKEEKILLQAGAKKLDDSGTKFELDGDKLILTRDNSYLAAIQVEFKKRSSVIKYEEIIRLAGRLRPLGDKESGGQFGIIGPAGYVTRSFQYSHAYIVRKEHTCSEDEEYNCGIIQFTIFYWLSLSGIVNDKKTEEVNDENALFRKVKYFMTVNGDEFDISETDFNNLIIGQSITLERAFGTKIARITGMIK